MGDDDKKKRPEPPKAVESPLPHLAEAMKKLGDMQVTITKVCEELEIKRQAEYIAAVAAWDSAEADKKAKEGADKKAAEELFNKREVARLKKKLLLSTLPADPALHPMANSKIVARVLQHDAFDKKNLQNFCLIGKAWVIPCRNLMFMELTNLEVKTKAQCENLGVLLSNRPALSDVVRSIKFSFQPQDASVSKQVALREALPSPIPFILLLTACTEALALEFHNMAAFGATAVILQNVVSRTEKVVMDPAGFAWHTKDVEFGTADDKRALFGAWSSLRELKLSRLNLRIFNPEGRNREEPATCPIENLALEKVRLSGRIYHMLQGAFRHLTHLSLVMVGSLHLRDLCQVLSQHGQSLLHLEIRSNQIIDYDSTNGQDEDDRGWDVGGPGDTWVPGSRSRHGQFDRALSNCTSLTHLSIEPGGCPVYQPSTLFRPLAKLEVLVFNKKDANTYDFSVWVTVMGLLSVLAEQRRKMKLIKFGHDWPSSGRQVARLQETWSRFSESVELGKLA